MKRITILAVIILVTACQPLFAQDNFVKRFIKRMYFDKDSTKKSNFILVPALASSPETGLEVGGASLFSFYTDTARHSITRVSSIFGYASITTKGQEKSSVTAHYWVPQNTWHFTGTLSFFNFPFDFFGIGNETRKANEELIDEKRFKLNLEAQKQITPNLYAGIVLGGFRYTYHPGSSNTALVFETDPAIESRHGGTGLYIGPALTFDNRNSNTYTTSGMLINTYFNAMHGVFGSNDYVGGLFNLDFSQFFQLQKHFVLAFNLKEQSLTGSESPFYLLPELGNDAMMRGYYTGRYRDRNLIAGQAELRYRINDRFGLTGFLGAGEVAHNSFTAGALKPTYGGGIRYFFDTEKGLSLRIDYGFGQKPAGEPREQGLYIALGEAF